MRCGGHTVSGSSPVAAASTSASVVVAGLARLHRLAGRDVRRPAARSSRAVAARPPGLAHLGAGAGHEHERARSGHRAVREELGQRGRRARSTWSGVCAAESATRSRDVPGGTVGGRMAVTSKPRVERAPSAASSARASLPQTYGHDRRRVARAAAGRRWRAAGPAARRPRASAAPAARRARRRRRRASTRW